MIGRHLFAACLAMSWLGVATYIAAPGDLPYTNGAGRGGVVRARVLPLLGCTGLFLALVELWALGHFQAWTAIAALGMMAGLLQWKKSMWDGDLVVELGSYAPTSACLLGYTIAYALTADPDPERVGWEAACGVLGAIFTLNGLMKWTQGGRNWFSARGLALLVAERAYVGAPWALRARRGLVSRPALCASLSIGAALLESAGFLFWIPALRVPLAAAWIVMLSGFGLFLGYAELEFMLLAFALAWNAG